MAELTKVKRCYHCGVELQDTDKDGKGYIRPDILKAYPEGLLLCDDCFKHERFNSAPHEADFEEGYQAILDEIIKKKSLVVYVIDLFSFEGSFISRITDILKGLDVLLVGNKRDLLPKETNDKELTEYVSHRLKIAGLDVKDVVLTSINNQYNIDLLVEKIKEYSNGKDVYVIGSSSSGKSALINEILKQYQNNTRYFITTYTFKNTDLRGFKIPLGGNSFMYETPGLSVDNSILFKVERSVQNALVPKKSVKPKRILMNKGSLVCFGGLAAVELLSKGKCYVDVYCSEKVTILSGKINFENSIEKFIKHKKVFPISQNFKSYADFDAYDFQITETGSRDIGILGLGWFSFIGNNQTFRISVPKGVFVYTTRSKIKHVEK